METLEQTILDAKRIMNKTGMGFATIWETETKKSKTYGFNFDKKEIGYSSEEYGVKRAVVHIIQK
ncbi:MAG: hypothetical protein KatS3mg035_1005 [Bacteroidia bacterium]|nr:MAG: hypothetical protein KatS3mg035_1005 [Bacteroidia bacterium]